MDGETFILDPDFSVIFGCRSSLSLIGLATGMVGYWLMERKWDNEGTAALGKPGQTVNNETEDGSSALYINMHDPNIVVGQSVDYNGARDIVRVDTDDGDDKRYHPGQAATQNTESVLSAEAAQYYGSPEVFWAHISMAFSLPRMMLTGLGLWNLSFFLDPSIGGLRFYANTWNVSCFILSALFGPILAYPMRTVTLERDLEQKKKIMLAFVVCSIFFCIVAIADPMVNAPWYFNIFGILFILTSYPVFIASRKMGYTWFLEGKPKTTSNIMIQNMGPMLLILGVFLLWVGTNAVSMADLNQSYVPFWTTNTRGWFAFIAGMFLIVPGQLAMDLAFDQGSKPVVPGFKDTYVYKLNGDTFAALAQEHLSQFDLVWIARWLETPLLGSIGWFLMGICSFMPFGVKEPTFQKFLTMFICFAVPPVHYVLLTSAFWRSDAVEYEKWLSVYFGLMVALAIAIGISSKISFLLSLIGVALILSGQRKDFYDERKRGTLWLTASPPTMNPNPQVFGLGQPLYIIGWIMLCAAMSIPM